MSRLLRTPKVQMALAIFIIFVTAFLRRPSILVIVSFLLSVAFTVGIDFLLMKKRKLEFFFPSAALVSGGIIGLVYEPSVLFILLFMLCAFSMISKHLLRINNRHIFNPAAFGLFTGGILFFSETWWGVSWQQLKPTDPFLFLSFLILLLPGYISFIRMRRFRIIISFYAVYTLFNYFIYKTPILDPTVIFFSLVMLPEPMTSPSKHEAQIFFGIFVALGAFFVSLLTSYVPSPFVYILSDPLIASLLLGNLLFFKWR